MLQRPQYVYNSNLVPSTSELNICVQVSSRFFSVYKLKESLRILRNTWLLTDPETFSSICDIDLEWMVFFLVVVLTISVLVRLG